MPVSFCRKIKVQDCIADQKLVRKTDGIVPSVGAIQEAAASFSKEKKQRGRREGWRQTSK